MANAALGMFNSYAEIGQRALTKYRSLSTDLFIQDSWRPTGKLTVEGGVRWAYWPPWYSLTNNIATFDPAAYDTTNQAVVSPSTGRIVSGPRYNGIVLPGTGFEGDGNDLAVASDPAVLALFVDAPRGFADTHANVFEPRIGAAYSINDKTIVKLSSGVFHNRVTVSDSMFLGGNPPFQPQVGVSNGIADNPGGVGGARLTAVRHDGHRSRVQAPDRVHVVGWCAAAGAVQLHRRRDLRRPARPVQRARARYQSAAARNRPGEPWCQPRRPQAVQRLRGDSSVGERCQLEVP